MSLFPFIGLIVLLLFSHEAHCSKEYQKHGFKITIPDGWVEIPSEVVEVKMSSSSKQAGISEIPQYDYGFQLIGKDNWFEYPYVLVHANRTNQLNEDGLKEFAKLNKKKLETTSRDGLESIISDVEIGSRYYDENLKMMWMQSEYNIPGFGKISSIICIKLTDWGVIRVNCYSVDSVFLSYLEAFQSIITSIRPN